MNKALFAPMNFLNPQIEALAKKKTKSLVRPNISCGIFQETEESNYKDDELDFIKRRVD